MCKIRFLDTNKMVLPRREPFCSSHISSIVLMQSNNFPSSGRCNFASRFELPNVCSGLLMVVTIMWERNSQSQGFVYIGSKMKVKVTSLPDGFIDNSI